MQNTIHTVLLGTTHLLSTNVITESDNVEHVMQIMNKRYREALEEEGLNAEKFAAQKLGSLMRK